MHYTHEQHLNQIEGEVLELKETLWEKPDREDLEYGLRDIVSELVSKLQAIEDALWEKPDRVDLEHLQNEVVSKLEEMHDDVRERKDEPEDEWGFGGEGFGLG